MSTDEITRRRRRPSRQRRLAFLVGGSVVSTSNPRVLELVDQLGALDNGLARPPPGACPVNS
jgi:hypothetical protein